jgi:hypothetical protein
MVIHMWRVYSPDGVSGAAERSYRYICREDCNSSRPNRIGFFDLMVEPRKVIFELRDGWNARRREEDDDAGKDGSGALAIKYSKLGIDGIDGRKARSITRRTGGARRNRD